MMERAQLDVIDAPADRSSRNGSGRRLEVEEDILTTHAGKQPPTMSAPRTVVEIFHVKKAEAIVTSARAQVRAQIIKQLYVVNL